ncbi:MAG TPA: DUF6188 family protein [Pirellulales bacterium]|nr:DUF6188 family protein [Pirellulales bacterium]
MFGLPQDIDLGFFDARELEQVCIGAHVVILNFDEDVSLTIEGDICHRSSAGAVMTFTSSTSAAATLVGLINGKVLTALRIHPGTLSLRFSNGESLEIPDTNECYESYQIWHGQRVIVV